MTQRPDTLARLAAAIAALLVVTVSACRREQPQPAAPIELWLGGDVHMGDVAGDPLAPLSEILGSTPGIVNLEGPVGEGARDSSAARLVNDRKALQHLVAHNVIVAGIANNHADDLGPLGSTTTQRSLRERGIRPAGGPAGTARVTMHGRTVSVTAHDLGAGLPSDLAAQLTAARAGSDLFVATFHITGPPSYLPRPELEAAVDAAIRAGADVVAAHGTHALAAVERRGQHVIAWGLGNLAFSCRCTDERDGLILRVTSNEHGVDAEVIPIRAGLAGEPTTPSDEAELIFELLEKLGSSPLRRLGDRAEL